MSIGVKIDPVEAWGWVCTAYTRNALVANAWSQLPLPYRAAWVMFIECVKAFICKQLQDQRPAADQGEYVQRITLEEAKRDRAAWAVQREKAISISPVIDTLRRELETEIGRKHHYKGKVEAAESEVGRLRVELAEANYTIKRLEQRLKCGDIIGVCLPGKHSPIREEDVFARTGSEESTAPPLKFGDKETQQRAEWQMTSKKKSFPAFHPIMPRDLFKLANDRQYRSKR